MAQQKYESHYGGESSAFGIAAIGNVANDTINLLRMWIDKDYSDKLRNSTDNYFYYLQLKQKEKTAKLVIAGIVLFLILKK